MVGEFTSTVSGEPLLLAALVLFLAFVHMASPEILQPLKVPPPVLLSLAGGVSIAYAFLHLFPLLDDHRIALSEGELGFLTLHEHHIYLIVFVGVILYYGLERLAMVTSEDRLFDFGRESVFWVHILGFAVYNLIIGYALVHGEMGAQNGLLFTVAMAFHLFGNDAALESHHPRLYERIGRWFLMFSVVLGAGIGVVFTLDRFWFAILLAVLTGGIVFNAIKDELPEMRDGRFWAFLAGAVGYTLILALTAAY